MKLSIVVLALAASAYASVVARVEGEVTVAASAKWLSIEEGISYKNGSTVSLAPRAGTEVVHCYGTGTKADRAPIISVIDDWCGRVFGTTVNNGQTIWARYDYGTFTILVSAEAINGCSWVVDGNCNRLLRLPTDRCNTNGENGKQGGFETDLCGQWRMDPGCCGSDF
ncbi:Glycoside hydrolase family 55 protein [Mycena venus]|uniref:Glycoside hydrolase family 55 protein n=1 Tax=Mycena venus TaxID=2733690 RepID=A0A8H6YHC0_9AGAR|nr:Glycoside hydrolase family 55 protein [Mycena venus]